MPDTMPRYAKIARPLLLRQLGVLLNMVTQDLPIQRPSLFCGPGLREDNAPGAVLQL